MMLLALTVLALDPVRLEAEDAHLEGPSFASARTGFSGRGYVTGITADKARLVWKHRAKAGIYDAKIGFSTPGGTKGYDLFVNGSRMSGQFPATGESFAVHPAGKIELREGENEIGIERGWGHYDVDFLELTPSATPRRLRAIPRRLSDSKATPETRRLFNALADRYGKTTLSGQYEIKEGNYVRAQTGRHPAVMGGDLMDYSPSRVAFGSKPRNATEHFVDAGRKGQIVTLSWHWNAPKDLINREDHVNAAGRKVNALWWRGFYTEATTFDVAKAMADPASEDYKLLLRDIDVIAVELRKFADAKVPVLWRPLHEAEGGWFWWGAKGPEPCKKLWRIMHDRLTNHHGLHNLIWVWNSAREDWYPGDDVVDVMSVDHYPSDRTDPLSGPWEDLIARFDGRKMLALAEFPGAPDVERMFRFGVRWSYFVSWTGGVGPSSTPPEILKRVYNSPLVITRDEVARPARP
ncbi:MAG: glycosyl hydrolase [Fimbriimonas sp.]